MITIWNRKLCGFLKQPLIFLKNPIYWVRGTVCSPYVQVAFPMSNCAKSVCSYHFVEEGYIIAGELEVEAFCHF